MSIRPLQKPVNYYDDWVYGQKKLCEEYKKSQKKGK